MNDALILAIGVALGAGAMYAAMRTSTGALRDAVGMLSSALHPSAPVPASIEREERAAAEGTPVAIDPTAVRAERVHGIRARLSELAMRTGTKMTDAELDEEAERLAGTDVHGGP